MDDMKMELVNPEWVILNEINNKELNQEDVAKTYALIIIQKLQVNWRKINKAIVDRWTYEGLERIKELAWNNINR